MSVPCFEGLLNWNENSQIGEALTDFSSAMWKDGFVYMTLNAIHRIVEDYVVWVGDGFQSKYLFHLCGPIGFLVHCMKTGIPILHSQSAEHAMFFGNLEVIERLLDEFDKTVKAYSLVNLQEVASQRASQSQEKTTTNYARWEANALLATVGAYRLLPHARANSFDRINGLNALCTWYRATYSFRRIAQGPGFVMGFRDVFAVEFITITYKSCMDIMFAFAPNAKLTPEGYLYQVSIMSGEKNNVDISRVTGKFLTLKTGKCRTVVPKYRTAKLAAVEETLIQRLCIIGDKLKHFCIRAQ